MTQLTRCPEGHFYDGNKFRTCPFCQQSGPAKVTQPMRQPPAVPEEPRLPGPETPGPESMEKTVGCYADMSVSPVTGWLVIIEGPGRGKDFRLCPGRNYIGRSNTMDVVLDGDQSVSRNKHAIVIFDPVSRTTLCQAGESRELFYLNGRVVTETVTLQRGDILSIGKTRLAFVPFCDENFSWDGQTEEKG